MKLFKISGIKKLLSLSKKVFNYTFNFWVAETLFFLIVDGWHYKPIRWQEEMCDHFATIGFVVSAADVAKHNGVLNAGTYIFTAHEVALFNELARCKHTSIWGSAIRAHTSTGVPNVSKFRDLIRQLKSQAFDNRDAMAEIIGLVGIKMLDEWKS